MCRLVFLFLEVVLHALNTIVLSVIKAENSKTLKYHVFYIELLFVVKSQ